MPNAAARRLGKLVITVHNRHRPTREEWKQYLDCLRELQTTYGSLDGATNLVFADSGPDAVQRREATDLVGERSIPVAVVTSQTLVRGVVTALSWFNPSIRAFAPSGWREAFRYLALPADQTEQVFRALRAMRDEVGEVEALQDVLLARPGA
jgi:hypothetical protein